MTPADIINALPLRVRVRVYDPVTTAYGVSEPLVATLVEPEYAAAWQAMVQRQLAKVADLPWQEFDDLGRRMTMTVVPMD